MYYWSNLFVQLQKKINKFKCPALTATRTVNVCVETYHNVTLLRKTVRRQAALLFIIVVHRPIVPQDQAVNISAQRHLIKVDFLCCHPHPPNT